MQAKRRIKGLGICLMLLGAALLAGGFCIAYTQYGREQQVQAANRQVREILLEEIIPRDPLLLDSEREMQALEILGSSYIGLLEIPSLGLCLPVEKDFSYDALRENVCLYMGSYLEENMVIAGHNYQCHFSRIGGLNSGDPVVFTSLLGNTYSYAVSSIEILDEYDLEHLQTAGAGLTLFTCTLKGDQRVVVRCAPAE